MQKKEQMVDVFKWSAIQTLNLLNAKGFYSTIKQSSLKTPCFDGKSNATFGRECSQKRTHTKNNSFQLKEPIILFVLYLIDNPKNTKKLEMSKTKYKNAHKTQRKVD